VPAAVPARRRWPLAVGAVAAVVLAGCSGSTPKAAGDSGSSATTTVTTSTGVTTSSAPGAASSVSSTPTSTIPTSQNLTVTTEVRAELVAAGAAMNSLPASAYTGLQPGRTYYAYDAATATYWAAAGLVPSSSSQQAQVSVQDDGAYVLFDQPAGGTWHARPIGLAGVPGNTSCPADLPAAVVALWNWAPGTCHPPA